VSLRVAVLSVHTCPLAALGGKETGGMNVYVRELSRELGRMGVVVDVFTRSQNATIPQIVRLGDRARVVHLPAGPQAPMARERVYDHLDAFVDGVDEWRMVRGIDYDLVHGHYWLSGVAALELRARWGVPVLQMFHTLARLKNGVAQSLADLEPDVRIVEETRVVGEVDRVVAANEVERAHLIEHYAARRERIAVIPCGVDTELFAPGDRATARAALGLDVRPTVLYVGRMTPIKGLDTLLDAVATLRGRVPDVRLLVVGGDTDEPRSTHQGAVRERCRQLGLESTVRFIGPQPQEVLRTYYVAADVTVLPSHYESFGMVALEAMACGGAVIASRVGGLTTTVLDGVTGLLVPEGDAEALAAQLAGLLARPELRRRLGREGVGWAARHRWPCVAEAVCREYTALAGRGREHLAVARCHE
jgi:D-inositol-3-phosphate glycosyltransferase